MSEEGEGEGGPTDSDGGRGGNVEKLHPPKKEEREVREVRNCWPPPGLY